MTTQTTQLAFPFLDSQGSYDFIEANVAESDRSGDITTDLKKALIAALELTGNNYALDDLWKRYQLSTLVTEDTDVEGPPARTPPEHAGQHPGHFLPPGRLKNAGGTGGFRGGTNNPASSPIPDLTNASFSSEVEWNTGSLFGMGPWSSDGTYIYHTNIPSSGNLLAYDRTATPGKLLAETGGPTTVESSWGNGRDSNWWDTGTSFIAMDLAANGFFTRTHNGAAYAAGLTGSNISDTNDQSLTLTAGRAPRSFDINPDGSSLIYASNATGRDVYQIDFSTAWDLSSGTEQSAWSPAEGDVFAIRWASDGSKLYVLASDNNLYQHTCSTPYDISTASTTADSGSIDFTADMSVGFVPVSFIFSTDNSELYVGDFNVTAGNAEMLIYTL